MTTAQEFAPLIGKVIDKACIEPLNLKNNAWAYFLRVILKEAVAKPIFLLHANLTQIFHRIAFFQIFSSLKTKVKTEG